MKLVTTVLLASMSLAFSLPPTNAQNSWLITAGKEWGPIYLDMTEQNALNEAGAAKILIDPFLSDNPSWDKGWSGYLAGKNSTQGGDR